MYDSAALCDLFLSGLFSCKSDLFDQNKIASNFTYLMEKPEIPEIQPEKEKNNGCA